MQQTFLDVRSALLRVILYGCAFAEIHVRSTQHVALSNHSIFVDFLSASNKSSIRRTVILVDVDLHKTIGLKPVPMNQSEGTVEFDCSFFRYAGSFQFRLQEEDNAEDYNNTDRTQSGGPWLSEVLHVRWPNFHIGVERTSNSTWRSFRIRISSEESFCPGSVTSSKVYLEVAFLEYNQVRSIEFDKVKQMVKKEIALLMSQWVELSCAYSMTDGDFIKVSLRSNFSDVEIKSSGHLSLSQIFGYKLVADESSLKNCETSLKVHLIPPPCASTHGKIILVQDGFGTADIQRFLEEGETKVNFNCSLFKFGKNNYCFQFVSEWSNSPRGSQHCSVISRLIDIWTPWQSWSSCSVTCGDGKRERHRMCVSVSSGKSDCPGASQETSICSLEDCRAIQTTSLVPIMPETTNTSSIVTVAGISICLFIIIFTVLVTVWRKVCQAHKCSSAMKHNSRHLSTFRKNSDEVNIYRQNQQRESFCESSVVGADAAENNDMDASVYQVNQQLHPEHGVVATEDPLPSAQKIIPPIFGYRLAHQQLKEMKKKGLKEATQIYHVSQNHLSDTVLDTSVVTSTDKESEEDTSQNKFRLISPFVDTTVAQPTLPAARSNPKAGFIFPQTNQGFPAHYGASRSNHKYTEDWVEMIDCGYLRNPQCKRTFSFHETKQPKPFRERSMSSCTTRQLSSYNARNRTLDPTRGRGVVRPKSRLEDSMTERNVPWDCTVSPPGLPAYYGKGSHLDTGFNKTDLFNERQTGVWPTDSEKMEANKNRRGSSPLHRNILARKMKEPKCSATYSAQTNVAMSPSQYRKSKCKSLPLDPECTLYGRSHFGLTESELSMIDLSEYFGTRAEKDKIPTPGTAKPMQ
ncbi:thrombospondin type-1 domain-containing protein 1 [Polypterus senegalus]|nr:thrombospondin type-1 domain-containing protein 1 [Polypterus senegalus]XP_039601781.1 thrombospondin type-1 domain-containing protein 1 [Polypterus senegalus]